MIKTPFQSKTINVNTIVGVLSAAVVVIDYLSGSNLIPASVGPWLVLASSVSNIVLRFLTTQPVKVL